MAKQMASMDGNEAVAYIAHRTNEVIIIYPITPSSPMGELSDEYTSKGRKNIWGIVPSVTEMQSEGGAAGAVHGSLQAGSLTTTFTASQGLLLMIPNMYKIAGELTPTVFHVSARSLAAQALSIFGDHQDVMAARQTGFAMIASNSIQEAMDTALIAQAATLEARIPFLHFFDGFRTSHEVGKVEIISDDVIRSMINDDLVIDHRKRAMSPDAPVLRGTSQNPDVYFQGRETVNQYYEKVPDIVQKYMDQFGKETGRNYKIYEYNGDPNAESVIVIMGSGAETVDETVDYLTEKGEKVGVLKVRLYRPFSAKHFLKALPTSVKNVAVLDRTKEPGASGEPMYLDVISAFNESFQDGERNSIPRILGGRYGLSSKEFTPAMIKGVFDHISGSNPFNHFTVGIKDDVTNLSISYDENFHIESDEVIRGVFFGLGADGTVSANKNSIKIIGETTDNYTQGYFVYDSKKSGAVTTSHLRFGKKPIRSEYLINRSNFVACHQFSFIEKYDMLKYADKGSIFLLNAPYEKDEVWNNLPRKVQQEIIDKEIKLYSIDAYKVAKETGMGVRINTIMQTCFFAISNVLPKEEAIQKIKDSIQKTFGKKGEDVVQKNYHAVDQTVANLHQIEVPNSVTSDIEMPPLISNKAPDMVKNILGKILHGDGDSLPVSAMPSDGTFPTATAQWEKRNIALEIPVWEEDICIQCNKCVMVCPHAAIRAKVYDGKVLDGAPETFKAVDVKGKDWPDGTKYTLQIAPEDCTGCYMCVEACPVKSKTEEGKKAINMESQIPLREKEAENWDFFLKVPEADRAKLKVDSVKGSQFLRPLFEFSGACSGCGETPYVKLASQLFGDRMIIANATGCSSIYGGNLPTTPWAVDDKGRGPTWSNSLFEDNAEFGMGFRLSIDKKKESAIELVKEMRSEIGSDLADKILANIENSTEEEIQNQREAVDELKKKIENNNSSQAKMLLSLSDYLVKKSVWIMGGDGWAYDIGYGGLDHVLASGENINMLVLDTEVYSNTGGQMSKSTPIGAVAKFAAGGKPVGKKDLGLLAITYGNIYVAQVAMGANDTQTVKAMMEAESYKGPSLIIAYSHCIAHGYDMRYGLDQQKKLVESGHWPLYRFDPRLVKEGKNPLKMDSKDPKIDLKEVIYNENRYKMLTKMDPQRADMLALAAQEEIDRKQFLYKTLAGADYSTLKKDRE